MMDLIFMAGSGDGNTQCQNISIINDGVRENVQNFSVRLNTTDPQVQLIPESATIILIDNDSK